MALIEIDRLSFTYPEEPQPVLSEITFSVRQGEFVVLCGPSGCGKTTLLRQLKAELQPVGERSGDIRYKGRPIQNYESLALAGEIGMVQQDPDNQIVMELVLQELAFGLENLGQPTDVMRRRIAEMTHFFGLEGWLHKQTHTLSGGQKQLVSLAAVLLLRPHVLLLDEPTAQLDPVAAKEFLQMLHRLNEEFGLTVIVTEHRLEELYPIADRVIMLDERGRVRYDGTPREVIGRVEAALDKPYAAYLPSPARLYAALQAQLPPAAGPAAAHEGEPWPTAAPPLSVKEGRAWLHGWLERAAARAADGPGLSAAAPSAVATASASAAVAALASASADAATGAAVWPDSASPPPFAEASAPVADAAPSTASADAAMWTAASPAPASAPLSAAAIGPNASPFVSSGLASAPSSESPAILEPFSSSAATTPSTEPPAPTPEPPLALSHPPLAAPTGFSAPPALAPRAVLLRCRDIAFHYEKGGRPVLRELDLDIAEGDFLAIVGGNGTGKSTLLRLLAGLAKPSRGRIAYRGAELRKYRKDALYREVGYLAQNPLSYFVADTVEGELRQAAARSTLSDPAARLDELVELLELAPALARHPHDLSGGERQKAALACVLLAGPKLLLLDEPTKGLDPQVKAAWGRLLQRLHAAGVTIVLVTHDIEFAAAHVRKCAMLFDGAIASEGAPAAFFGENFFYTTVLNRLARDHFPQAVTEKEVLAACRGIASLS